jgi:hypothetical protein
VSKPRPQLVSSTRLKCGVTAEPQYLSGLDIFHAHAGMAIMLCFKQGFDIDHARRALATTLAKYPWMAGRYKTDKQGHVYLDANDAGMDWNLWQHQGPMPYGPQRSVGSDIHKLYKLWLPWRVVNHDQPLFQINVHRYADGGVVVCFLGAHSNMDGSSWWGLAHEWSRACLGQEPKGANANRQLVIDAGQPEPDHQAYDLMVAPPLGQWLWAMVRLGWNAAVGYQSETHIIPAEVMQRWKDQAKAELTSSAGVSAAELVTCYIMKAMSPAMPRGVMRSIGQVLDLRFKRRLRLPRDYFGNALCYAEARYTEQQMAELSVPKLAELCRPPNEQVSTEALQKMLWFTERWRQKKAVWRMIFKPTVETLNAGLIQNNVIPFPIYDIDLGNGGPSWYDVTPMTIRMVMLAHTPQKDGGVVMYVTAKRRELAALRAQLQRDGVSTAS